MFTYIYAAFLFMEMEQNNKPELAEKISIELKYGLYQFGLTAVM